MSKNHSEVDVGGDQRNELFEVLSHSQRRFVLHYLRSADTPIDVDDLVSEVVAWEVERPVDERSAGDRDAVELSLVHTHLPKMAAAGLVDYDAGRGVLTPTDRTDAARPHLQPTD